MQNRCNCGCGCNQSFVPVNGNWDFNMNGDCGCNSGYANRSARRRSNNGCQQCGVYESANDYNRENDRQSGSDRQLGSDCQSGSDCQCERCDDSREVECCDQNTYIRDMDGCGCDSNNNRNRSGNNGCDECESTCTRSRNRSRRSNDCDNGCNCNGESAYTRTRSNGCGCDKDNGSTYVRQSGSDRSRKNRTVGMINVEMQEIDEIFESESALRAGTLFPELHKPMNGYCPCDGNCATCKQAAAFAAWEMRLYLNTHPNDKEALALFRKLCKEAEEENYATTFLTDECCMSGWNWVKNPWPWEYDCQCGD